ncbi:MAG: type II toxin-antitoxin system RelE/ParE family toxin [Nanoarchaeota archaeon]|nr:type II toxin-antitoxin system RelE/ParE family toxin [Nanoarchaeota archaeon]
MYSVILSEQFEKTFSKIKDRSIQQQIWNKILELETRAPIGKKLKGNPYWSIHIGQYRIIYAFRSGQILIADILPRKKEYREIR